MLLLEDEPRLGQAVARALAAQGYGVRWARSLGEAREAFLELEPDLMVLDVRLPEDEDGGFRFAKEAREAGYKGPILFLTARDALEDRVQGLDLGGDDYLVKPYSLQELLARLEALVRRARRREEVLAYKDLRLYPRRMEAFRGERRLALSPKAFLLLKAFLEAPEGVLSKEALMRKVWGEEVEPATLEVHLSALRKALGEPSPIQTVRGYGYRLFLPEG